MLLAVHYRVMEHLGSLESTQEAKVALGYRLGQLLRFFRALQTFRVLHLSNGKRFPCLHSLTYTRERLGEFSTVMQTRDEMQTLDFVSGLHNCLEFSQPLECL